MFCFIFKQKTAYEMRISDWSSDVCSSDLDLKLWDFADPKAGWPMLYNYRREREGEFTAAQVQAAMEQMHKSAPMKQKKTDEVALNKYMPLRRIGPNKARSEEQTSELQSIMRSSYPVFCLKKKNIYFHTT